MKFKLSILGLVLLISSIVVGIVKAEDLKCKTMSNGVCTEYFQPETKCKTMVNSRCTEFYNQTNSDIVYQEPPKTDMKYLNKKESRKICNNSFGFDIVLDPFNRRLEPFVGYVNNKARIYITNIEKNSPAEKANLKIGDEILKINNEKVERYNIDIFNNYLSNLNNAIFLIKKTDGKVQEISLSKMNICTTKEFEPFFNEYWTQVYSDDLDYYLKISSYTARVSNKLTPTFKTKYSSKVNRYYELDNKRKSFRQGFNLCLSNNYNKNDVVYCLNRLVDRSIGLMTHEENINMQRYNIQAQQEMTNQHVNAINNYSDALRNQHVQVDANVYHSGNVNVNHNIDANVNVNGNYYHHW